MQYCAGGACSIVQPVTTELRVRNAAQQIYVRALSTAWRNRVQLYEPSTWLTRDPETEEKMLRDGDIAHAVGFRRHLIAGKQWQLQPRHKASPRADLAVAVGTELLQEVERFTEARQNLARAFFSGARFAIIHGEPRVMTIGDGQPRTWWVPTRLEDQDKRLYRIAPMGEGEQLSARWQIWDVASAQWCDIRSTTRIIRHVYQDDQATLGYGRALREALGWWWYAKEHVFHESLQAVERFAQGIITAKVDGARDAETGLPNEELIRSWVDHLEDMRSRHVLVHDKSDDVAMVPMDGSGWELASTMRQELRSAIFTLVLGANLTTSADKGGSFALAEIQENSTEALIQFDRESLEETLTKDLLGCMWWHNHANMRELGLVQEMPRFSINQEKILDPEVRARVAQLIHGMGVPLATDDLYEQTGFRRPQEGEDQIAGSMPAPVLGGAFGGLA